MEFFRHKVKPVSAAFMCVVILFGFYSDTNGSDRVKFRVASYNVENLFDLKNDGTEYREYIPGPKFYWQEKIAVRKYANISKVISTLNADIVALQEIESRTALKRLLETLDATGNSYRYSVISEKKGSIVRCALISRYRITDSTELFTERMNRSVLKTTLSISGRDLIIYVNHWPSKRLPESRRLIYAERLRKDIDKLPENSEYIIVGDFNSDYNESVSFRKNRKLNDTSGRTGINHVLKTATSGFADRNKNECRNCLYNLWFELKPEERWSYRFRGRKSTLDNFLIPDSLLDQRQFEYVKGSFRQYRPDYLMKGNRIYRWQMSKTGKHTGKGFSDHLPVSAVFMLNK